MEAFEALLDHHTAQVRGTQIEMCELIAERDQAKRERDWLQAQITALEAERPVADPFDGLRRYAFWFTVPDRRRQHISDCR